MPPRRKRKIPHPRAIRHPSGWTWEQVAQWKRGSWTREKINTLVLEYENHHEACNSCHLIALSSDEWDWIDCPIADAMVDAIVRADTEFSWQPDYEPDPEWSEPDDDFEEF